MKPTRLMRMEEPEGIPVYEVRDLISIGLRWRKRMLVVMAMVLLATVYFAFSSFSYKSQMKIMVHRGRIDPPVTPDKENPWVRSEIDPAEMTSEVELLRSDDVLRQVAQRTGMAKSATTPLWMRLTGIQTSSAEDIRTEKAVRSLESALAIELPKDSNILTVSFEAKTPAAAHQVLSELSEAYLNKHAAINRPPGQLEFFTAQAEEFGRRLADANAQLAKFSSSGGTILGEEEVAFAVNKLGELRHELRRTMVDIDEARQRASSLETQLADTPPRMTTAVRSAENPHLMMELKKTLLERELKRTELLETFEPSYRLVTEVEKEIAQTRAAIAAAEGSPTRDETTDRDPTFEWLRSELARTRTQLASLEARAASIRGSAGSYESQAQQLVGSKLEQQNLERDIKQLDETYQLYVAKREEARFGNALDSNRILSVSIAQSPTMPALPERSPTVTLAAGFLLALIMGLGTVLLSEFLDSFLSNSFRTVQDVRVYIDAPIVCALPPIKEPSKTLDTHA